MFVKQCSFCSVSLPFSHQIIENTEPFFFFLNLRGDNFFFTPHARRNVEKEVYFRDEKSASVVVVFVFFSDSFVCSDCLGSLAWSRRDPDRDAKCSLQPRRRQVGRKRAKEMAIFYLRLLAFSFLTQNGMEKLRLILSPFTKETN